MRLKFSLSRGLAPIAFAASLLAPPVLAQSATPLTKEQAHSIAVDAYVYLYPLVSMEISR